MDVFWSLPPVTRTITAAAVAVSALGYGGVINLRQYIFVRQWVFTMKKMPEIWRLFTAFMITKPKFAILFDSYFLYRYGSDLEKESSRFSQPGDFFVYTIFLGSVIIGLAGCLLGSYTFLPALSLAYAYTFAQDNPTRSVSFFIITFEAKYLPLAMVFITFIVDGQHEALSQGTGIIAAHLYDFLTRIWPTFGGGRRYIFTPQTVKQWFGGRAGVQQARPYGFAQQGRGADTDSRPTARATGFGGQWDGRGPGRRLGGT